MQPQSHKNPRARLWRRVFRTAPLLVAWLAVLPASAEDGVRLTSLEQWMTVFGDIQTQRNFLVAAERPRDAVLNWRLSANQRTIDAGQSVLRLAAGEPSKVAIRMRIPAVNEGVVLQTQLQVTVALSDGQIVAEWLQPIHVFPRDPFFEKRQWLRERAISLYDPVGETAKVLESAEMPFQRIHNAALIPRLDRGLLIVGEGLPFSRHRSLAETLVALGQRGVPVLCLAPRDGSFALPEAADGQERPAMTFRSRDAITDFDKRLDHQQWMSTVDIAPAQIDLRAVQGRVQAIVSPSAGWPWWEVQFPDRSSLAVCGFAIVEHWNDGPTPRFLLARLIAMIASKNGTVIDSPFLTDSIPGDVSCSVE